MHHSCYFAAKAAAPLQNGDNNNFEKVTIKEQQHQQQQQWQQTVFSQNVNQAQGLDMVPLFCQTDDEKQSSDNPSPGLVTISSSSSSNDQGLGDEIPDENDCFEALNELEAAINRRFSFYENIPNLDCSLNLSPAMNDSKNIKWRQNIFPTGKPPIYPALKKTKIPKPMSSSVSETSTRDFNKIKPDASCRTSTNNGYLTFDQSQSYHGNLNGYHSRFSLSTQGSAEQLAERILTPKEESAELLRRCKDGWRKPVFQTPYLPERSVIMPIKRQIPIPPILSPFPDDFDLPPPLEESQTIQTCLARIMKASDTLRNIEENVVLSPLKCNSLPREKPKLERNPDADKYKNPFGGRIYPVERKLSIFRNPRTPCLCCRSDSVLHRLNERVYLRRQNRVTVRVMKRYVVIRDRCHCFSKEDNETVITKPSLFINEPPFAYIIWLAALSCIIRVLLFIFYHE